MNQETSTLDFVKIFTRSIRELIQGSSGVKLHVSKTAMQIQGISITGDIGAFVSFNGDYNGIMILNFEGEAALEIVAGYLTKLGLGPEDIPRIFQNDEVRNNIGEITNQIIGKCRTQVQDLIDLSARANIPAVVPISVPIGLSMDTKGSSSLECVRVAFTTEKRNKFHMELALEPMVNHPLEI